MGVWVCGQCGVRWERPAALFCSYCGFRRVTAAPAAIDLAGGAAEAWRRIDKPGPHGPFTAKLGVERPLAWAGVDRDNVHVLLADEQRIRIARAELSSQDLALRPVAEAVVPPAALVSPPLATRRGLYLVCGDHVLWLPPGGDYLEPWRAPQGSRIVGAALSAFGEIWLAVLGREALSIYVGGGESDWRPWAELSAGSFTSDQAVLLAVDSDAPRVGRVVLWGGGRVIVAENGAAGAQSPAATEKVPVSWLDRGKGTTIFQRPPHPGSLLLMPGEGLVALRLGDDGPRMTALPEVTDSRVVAVTGDGGVWATSGGEMVSVVLDEPMPRTSRTPLGAPSSMVAALPLGRQLLCVMRLDGGATAFAVFDRRGQSGIQQQAWMEPVVPPQSVMRSQGFAPLLLDGEVWAGASISIGAQHRLVVWRAGTV